VSDIPKSALPVKGLPAKQLKITNIIYPNTTEYKKNEPQPGFWAKKSSPNLDNLTVESAIERCKASQFKSEIVGEMLSKLAIQNNGIEKAIGFASVIAQYVRNQNKKSEANKTS